MTTQAVQKLSRGKPLKQARCPMPSHVDRFGRGALSSNFLGEQEDFEGARFWAFSCHHGGKPYHSFLALPDPAAPRRVEDYAAWLEAQKAGTEKPGLA